MNHKMMDELFGFASETYHSWEKEEEERGERPVVSLLENYFTKFDINEFLKVGKVTRLDNSTQAGLEMNELTTALLKSLTDTLGKETTRKTLLLVDKFNNLYHRNRMGPNSEALKDTTLDNYIIGGFEKFETIAMMRENNVEAKEYLEMFRMIENLSKGCTLGVVARNTRKMIDQIVPSVPKNRDESLQPFLICIDDNITVSVIISKATSSKGDVRYACKSLSAHGARDIAWAQSLDELMSSGLEEKLIAVLDTQSILKYIYEGEDDHRAIREITLNMHEKGLLDDPISKESPRKEKLEEDERPMTPKTKAPAQR